MGLTLCGIAPHTAMAMAQQGVSIGQLKALEGTPTVRHQGRTQTQPLVLQSPVYRQDFIQTQSASKLQLHLRDGTLLTLREEGTLKISDFVYAPQRQVQRSLLTKARIDALRQATTLP